MELSKLPFPEAEEPEEPVSCVKEFIGKKLQDAGIVCSCAKCKAERGDPGSSKQERNPRNGKMAAAHDIEEEER